MTFAPTCAIVIVSAGNETSALAPATQLRAPPPDPRTHVPTNAPGGQGPASRGPASDGDAVSLAMASTTAVVGADASLGEPAARLELQPISARSEAAVAASGRPSEGLARRGPRIMAPA
jgi:hypothetical protein